MNARVRILQARLQRTTMRERLLLGGLVLAALVMAPVALLDWRDVQRDRYIDATTERSAARLAQAASRRITATAPDQAAITDMKTWGFKASNLAVAQVILEQKLVEAATRAGLTNIKITTSPEIEVIGPNQWLGAEIQADLRWGPTFAFLDDLGAWPEGFTVKQFAYEIMAMPNNAVAQTQGQTMNQPLGRITVAVAVPVSVADPSPAT